jgi:RNase H-like domain found in reverse transcriptase
LEAYLIFKEFILYSDHEALKFINGQHKLKPRHARWVKFLQGYTFHIKHKSGASNQVAYALSRRHSLLSKMKANVLRFEVIKELYVDDEFFGKIKDECAKGPYKEFMVNDGYLLYGNRLCISNYSLR